MTPGGPPCAVFRERRREVSLYHPEMNNNNGTRFTWRGVADASGAIAVTDYPEGRGRGTTTLRQRAEPSNEVIATSFAGLNGTANGKNIADPAAAPDYANLPAAPSGRKRESTRLSMWTL